jgi:predicted Zn-dependent protease with MMP-like domain
MQQIIMNYSVPPNAEELEVIAQSALDNLPEELAEFCEALLIEIEEIPDEALEQEFDLDDPFDMLALFRRSGQISPGVEKKVANDDDTLVLFRRPILDIWCETCEDINMLVRQTVIEELGQVYDFADDEIDEMIQRHNQSFL